jgi:hypothetical protein
MSVRWAEGIPNRNHPRLYARTRTVRLRRKLSKDPSGEAVYREDNQGVCYYINSIVMGCYRTLNELMDAWDVELEEHRGGVTRSKIRKQKRRKTRRHRR